MGDYNYMNYMNTAYKGPVKIKIIPMNDTGKEIEFQFDHCSIEQFKGVKKCFAPSGEFRDMVFDGRERLSLKMWSGMSAYEDLDEETADKYEDLDEETVEMKKEYRCERIVKNKTAIEGLLNMYYEEDYELDDIIECSSEICIFIFRLLPHD